MPCMATGRVGAAAMRLRSCHMRQRDATGNQQKGDSASQNRRKGCPEHDDTPIIGVTSNYRLVPDDVESNSTQNIHD